MSQDNEPQITISDVSTENGGVQFRLAGSHGYGLDKSVVNAIRRTLLNAIPTVAFETDEDIPTKDLTVRVNDTPIHNEMITHRVALVPLYINPEEYWKSLYFECHVIHDTSDPYRFITSNDMEIYRLKPDIQQRIDDIRNESIESDPREEESINDLLETNSPDNYDKKKPLDQAEKNMIFKPFEYPKGSGHKHYCLLNELKHTGTDNEFQKQHFFGSPSVKTGQHDSRYQAVSQASYSFVQDDISVQTALEEKIKLPPGV